MKKEYGKDQLSSDLKIILATIAVLGTCLKVHVLIEHDTITVTGNKDGRAIKFVLSLTSSDIEYFMKGERHGSVDVACYVDNVRAFSHVTVNPLDYNMVITQVLALRQLQKSEQEAFSFLGLAGIEI